MDRSRLWNLPFLFALSALTSGAVLAAQAQEKSPPVRAASNRARSIEAFANLPLYFEPNQGQAEAQVKYLSRGAGHLLFLTPSKAVLVLTKREHSESWKTERRTSGTVLHMAFRGANRQAQISGQEELSGKVNYFIGDDPGKWRTNIATYGRVLYRGLYPGIDLAYYGLHGQLEYDFVVSPGADPRRIVLTFKGAERVDIDAHGDLVLLTDLGVIRQRKPVVYQEISGVRQEISADYVLKGAHQVAFKVGAYDATKPLIIDPVLVYSTFLGGSGSDLGYGIAVDSSGNAYVAGFTASTDFPTTPGAFQTVLALGSDAFVTKLNPVGSAPLVYSTYLGGNGADYGFAIAVDSLRNAYVTGQTDSTNFPTTPGAFQTGFGSGLVDAFVTKLNPTGSALSYSTYLGGGSFDSGQGIAVDGSGNAYATGYTLSTDFPTTPGAFQTTSGGSYDAFVTKLSPTGSAPLVYSTYLGGSGIDVGSAIAVDTLGNAYVTGYADPNFPTTTSAFQTTYGGGSADAFVTKLNPAGSAPLAYSTYLGGNGQDIGQAIAVDGSGNAYVTGYTDSVSFPTTRGAFQTTFGGGFYDSFVTKLSPTDSAPLVYSTYLGGSGIDVGYGIAVDSSGNAYVGGYTNSTNFPTTTGAFQTTFGGGASDAFVTKLNPGGSAPLVYSTYLGGSGEDVGQAIAVDSFRNSYVTGYTASSNFPTTGGAFQTTFGGGSYDAFVATLAISPRPNPACTGTLLLPGVPEPSVGRHPTSVTAGDFNGDGNLDLAVTNDSSNNVSVLLGNGDGTFRAAANYDVGFFPNSVTSGDFNGDGKPDLAVANQGSNNVSVLLGNGDGTFQAAVSYPAGSNPVSVTSGDFNGDGKPDLAVASAGSDLVNVLLGNGDGTFQAAVSYPAGSLPFSVTSGDFNGDGKPDLAVANASSNNVSILLGNGDGTFQAAVSYGVATNPRSVTSGDFNGDGKLDLVTANAYGNNVSILLGNGDGTFQAAVNYDVDFWPLSVTSGDFNGDGKPDLAVANQGSNNVSVLLGNGDGTFQAALSYGGRTPFSVVSGDFNGDGKPDLAVANRGSNNVSVLLGNGDGTFLAPASYLAGSNPVSVVSADFNGDGKPDLAVVNNGSNTVSVLLGNGNGTFQAAVSYSVGSALPVSVTSGDFNGDGKLDLAVALQATDRVSVLLGNGDGTFQAAVPYAVGSGPLSVASGDFNGDGFLDLATANRTNVSVLLGNGDGTFQPAVGYGTDPSRRSVTIADFNGDGKLDLALAGGTNPGTNDNSVNVLLGNGDGTFQAAVSYHQTGSVLFSVTSGDFNGDGKLDLVAANGSWDTFAPEGSVSVLLGNGDGTFQAAVNYAVGFLPLSVMSGDFNGDGKLDLAVANQKSNSVSVLLGNGDGTFRVAVSYSAGTAPASVTSGDFNGDGKLDLVTANAYGNNVSILLDTGCLP